MAAFYRALQEGASGNDGNPLFYVSSSPWNFYDLFAENFRIHELPVGPLELRDYDWRRLFRRSPHHEHKLSKIEPIFEMYPNLPFVLVGDSGQQDPEIYTELARRHPNRIKAIYIRRVKEDAGRLAAIAALAEEVHKAGCPLVVTPDSEFAAQHAAGHGLIRPREVPAVHTDKVQDEAAGTPAKADATPPPSEVVTG